MSRKVLRIVKIENDIASPVGILPIRDDFTYNYIDIPNELRTLSNTLSKARRNGAWSAETASQFSFDIIDELIKGLIDNPFFPSFIIIGDKSLGGFTVRATLEEDEQEDINEPLH